MPASGPTAELVDCVSRRCVGILCLSELTHKVAPARIQAMTTLNKSDSPLGSVLLTTAVRVGKAVHEPE